MLRFAILRAARALLTILLVVTLAFFILRASSDPAQVMLGPDAPPEAIAAFRHAWGLDRPLWVQYADYLGAVLHGDFGRSMREGLPAMAVVLDRVPATLAITVPALLLAVLLGVPAGMLAALRRNSVLDRAIMAAAIAGFTVPSFVLALVLVLIFAVHLGWLPSGGNDRWVGGDPAGAGARPRRRRRARALLAQRDGGDPGPALYPHGERQGPVMARRRASARACRTRPSRSSRSSAS